MKQIFLFALYFFSSLLFSIGLTACSSSNNLNNELNYYNYINEKTEGKEVRITTLGGENLKGKNLSLKKDSSSWINIMELKTVISKSDIENVTYIEGGYNNSAVIKLKSGNIISGKQIEADNTSISFFTFKESPIKMPTDNIKKISIKNRLSSALIGFGIGFFAGGITGTLINIGDARKIDTLTFPGAVVGGVIGLVTGALIGTWRDYYLR